MYDNAARQLARYQEHRMDAIVYLGGICCDCGYKEDLRALQFDHVAHERTRGERTVASSLCFSWPKIQALLDDCELVCANCHAIRTAKRREARRS